MSFHGKLYLPLLFALTGLLGGCHSAVLGDYPDTCATGEEQQVRITAVVERYAVQGDPASTRSFNKPGTPGALEEGDATPFQPEVVEGDEVEKKITNMVVYIFSDTGVDDDENFPIKKLVVGAAPGTPHASGFDYVDFETNNMEQGKASFLVSLAPGQYAFYCYVNDVRFSSLTGSTDPSLFGVTFPPFPVTQKDLSEDGIDIHVLKSEESDLPSFSGPIFGSLTASLMPMAGMGAVNVPENLRDQDIYDSKPEIELERVLSKVEFYLTTARVVNNPETGQNELVYLNPLLEQVTEQMTTEPSQSPVPLLYLADYRTKPEYISDSFFHGLKDTPKVGGTPTHITDPSLPPFVDVYTRPVVDEEYIDKDSKLVSSTGTTYRRLRKVMAEKPVKEIYIRPLYFWGVGDSGMGEDGVLGLEEEMPYFRFLVTTHFPDPVDRYFNIPLYTTDERGDPRYYLRRNTIYRIYATLNIDADGEVTLDLLHNVGDYPTVNIPVPPFN